MASQEAQSFSGMYRLLARLWLREADAPLLEALSRPPLGDALAEIGGCLPKDHSRKTIECLASDYCQLFVGPTGHLPPCQSVWQSDQFQAAPVQSMQRFVDLVAYDTRVLPDRVMLDHLGVQLDVMGYLWRRISESTADQQMLENITEVAWAFFQQHLSWPWALLEQAEWQAKSPFYRTVVALSRDFLRLQQTDVSWTTSA